MDQCITKPIVLTDMSGCLVERPACNYAVKMGFSYWCTHPDHSKFNGHVTGLMSREELAKRYTLLRHKRQDAFVVGLDDGIREQFASQLGSGEKADASAFCRTEEEPSAIGSGTIN